MTVTLDATSSEADLISLISPWSPRDVKELSKPAFHSGVEVRSNHRARKWRASEASTRKRRRREEARDKQPSLDQFVKKHQQRTQGIQVIADSREMNSDVVKKLIDLGVELKVETLKTGDYVLSDRCVVERKTVSDFCTSIIDGRLFTQVASLRDLYEKPVVLVEGGTLYGSRNVLPQAILGALASVLIDYGVPLVRTESCEETALLLASIARREQLEKKREPRVRVKHKPATMKEAQEFVVAGLPNVDTIRARRLLEAFETVEEVFTKDEEELRHVRGIGKKIAESIRKVLTSKYPKNEGEQRDDN